jgi:pimeloyl-ACP methyl ester carboxylesterase
MKSPITETPRLNSQPNAQRSGLSTRKYEQYRTEVEAKLAGKLSKNERRRYEHEHMLLDRAQFIEINGVVHHYQDVGPRDGEPLLLIHGWDCSAFWWHRIVDPLVAAGYRVITFDLKGHGFSDNDPARGYTIAGFSKDTRDLGDALGLGPQHVAAFSLGAFIALHYAANAPDRVRSLTFFNFSLMPYYEFASNIVPKLLDTVFNRILRPIERLGLWWLPFVYARLVLAQNTPPVNDIKLGTLSLRLCEPDAIRISSQELACREVLESVTDQMRSVKQPTLLVAGSKDPVMRPSSGRKLINLAQNGSYVEVPKCGHLILFELPEQVIQILRLFLRGVRG